jgi:integrase
MLMPRIARSPRRRGFGSIRRLPSGRYQASYLAPDTIRRTAPTTFEAREDAEAWLTDRRREITAAGDDWTPPPVRKRPAPLTFGEYAAGWLAARDLRPRSKVLYESLLRVHLLPTFGNQQLTAITAADVKRWHSALSTGPTARANAYGLLRTIMADAADEEVIARSPVRIKGAGSKRRARELRVLTPGELAAIADAVPRRYRAFVLLGGWCSLRFGELAALRRSDIDLKQGLVHVRRAVTAVPGQPKFEGTPKSESSRLVTIPPHVLPDLRDHLRAHAAFGRDGLVFPPASGEGYLAVSTLHRVFDRAKVKAGRPDVRVHDLRHFGAIMAARTGATLGELQQRLGHRSAQAAMVYQSAVSERPTAIAVAMSELVSDARS